MLAPRKPFVAVVRYSCLADGAPDLTGLTGVREHLVGSTGVCGHHDHDDDWTVRNSVLLGPELILTRRLAEVDGTILRHHRNAARQHRTRRRGPVAFAPLPFGRWTWPSFSGRPEMSDLQREEDPLLVWLKKLQEMLW